MKRSNKLAMIAGMMAFMADAQSPLDLRPVWQRKPATLRNKTPNFDGITIGTYSNTQTAFFIENYRIYALNRSNADRKLARYKRLNNITD